MQAKTKLTQSSRVQTNAWARVGGARVRVLPHGDAQGALAGGGAAVADQQRVIEQRQPGDDVEGQPAQAEREKAENDDEQCQAPADDGDEDAVEDQAP